MDTELLPTAAIIPLSTVGGALSLPPHILSQLPAMVVDAGDKAAFHFAEFFTANIRNPHTRRAYVRAVGDFMRWADQHRVTLQEITPITVAAYIEGQTGSPQSVQQRLAALRMLFDHLVVKQVIPANPAAAVRGPKYVIKKGKTPALSTEDTRRLLDSIDTSDVAGLRDRALIGVMVFSFARVGAVVKMDVGDYYVNGKRWWLRLHEKGGRFHEVPVHHKAEAYLDEYLAAAGIAGDRKSPLFRTVQGRPVKLTANRIRANDVLRMVKRRAEAIGLPYSTCCHTFRATGITACFENGGTLEHAQQIAAHESPRTTKLYDRTSDQISLDEIERISI